MDQLSPGSPIVAVVGGVIGGLILALLIGMVIGVLCVLTVKLKSKGSEEIQENEGVSFRNGIYDEGKIHTVYYFSVTTCFDNSPVDDVNGCFPTGYQHAGTGPKATSVLSCDSEKFQVSLDRPSAES